MLVTGNRNLSGAALVAANLVPVIGVLFFGWDIRDALILYWAENLVVGFYAVLRIALSVGPVFQKALVIPFFLFHFGLFTFAQGFLVAVMVSGFARGPARGMADLFLSIVLPVLWGIAALFVSHGTSFIANYVRGGERLAATPDKEMQRPYGRVGLLNLTILASGFLMLAAGGFAAPSSGLVPQIPSLLLIALKTAADLLAHRREHRQRDLDRATPSRDTRSGAGK